MEQIYQYNIKIKMEQAPMTEQQTQSLSAKKIPIQTLILYASQTGNCEQISEDLLEDVRQNKDNDGLLKDVKRFQLNSLLE